MGQESSGQHGGLRTGQLACHLQTEGWEEESKRREICTTRVHGRLQRPAPVSDHQVWAGVGRRPGLRFIDGHFGTRRLRKRGFCATQLWLLGEGAKKTGWW